MTPEAANEADSGRRKSLAFPKAYRLKRRRLIRPLFDRDDPGVAALTSGSLRLLYRFVDPAEAGAHTPLQAGFFVGKKVGKATERNRIRRRMRESFRKRIASVVPALMARDEMLTVAFVFRGTTETRWAEIDSEMDTLVLRLLQNLSRPGR